MTLSVDSLVPALQFMEDAVRTPLFKQDELVRERPVVLGEFDRNEASPFFHLSRGVDTLLWTRAYYSRKNVIGDREVIATTPPAKMHAIQRRYYVPNNTALILSGDITPARGFQLAEQIFGDWPRGDDPFATPVPAPPPLTKSQAVIVEKPVNSVTLLMAWQGPRADQDTAATYAADVLSTVLRNPTSKFHKALIQSGLTFDAGISYYTQANVGPINAMLQTAPEKLLEAKQTLLSEIAKLEDDSYITDEELAAARSQLGIQALYERERTSEWAHTVGFWWAVTGLDYYRNYVPNMQKVSKADIARYARTYLRGKPYVVGVLIDPKTREALKLTPAMLLTPEVVP
jgi:zinc protease